MKKIILLITLFLTTTCFSQKNNTNIKWETNFETAKKKAAKTNKPILMLFTGSDWCRPCKALKKEFFNSERFRIYNKKFIFMYVNFPRNKSLVTPKEVAQNKKLNSRYAVKSLPTIITVNTKGNVIGSIKGYNSTGETHYHYDFIESALKKHYKLNAQ